MSQVPGFKAPPFQGPIHYDPAWIQYTTDMVQAGNSRDL